MRMSARNVYLREFIESKMDNPRAAAISLGLSANYFRRYFEEENLNTIIDESVMDAMTPHGFDKNFYLTGIKYQGIQNKDSTNAPCDNQTDTAESPDILKCKIKMLEQERDWLRKGYDSALRSLPGLADHQQGTKRAGSGM